MDVHPPTDADIAARYRASLDMQRQLLDIERQSSKQNSRRWATLVILLLTLGALIFAVIVYRQENIIGDLKQQARRSCELRNANDALLRSTWGQLSREFTLKDPSVTRIYASALANMKPPRDCSIFAR